MKKIIKKILSSRLIREFFNLSWDPHYDYTFHDKTFSFSEAIKKIDSNKNYKNFKDTIKYLENEVKDKKEFKLHSGDVNTFVPLMISCLNQSGENKINSILDIGGGENPISLYINKYTAKEIDSCVLETDYIANKLNKVASNLKYINYFSDLKKITNKKFDLVYFGSSLQYFWNNNYEILSSIMEYEPKFIVFTRNFFIDTNEDLYSLQACGRHHLVPHIFFSKKKFKEFFVNNKYSLIFETTHNNIYKHKKIDNREFEYKSFIFKKNL